MKIAARHRVLKGGARSRAWTSQRDPDLGSQKVPHIAPRLTPEQVYLDHMGQPIHLYTDRLKTPICPDDDRLYGRRIAALFSGPDEVWQDVDPSTGVCLRFLKFHFDHVLVAVVDTGDPADKFVVEWFAIEHDVPFREGGRRIEDQRNGTLLHGRYRSMGPAPAPSAGFL
jgi:hypothetical protein